MILNTPKEYFFKYKKHICTLGAINILLVIVTHGYQGISWQMLNLFIILSLMELATALIMYTYSDNKDTVSELLPFIVYDIESKTSVYSEPLKLITSQNLLSKNIFLSNDQTICIEKILLKISQEMDDEPSTSAFESGLIKIEEKHYKTSFAHDGNQSIFVTFYECSNFIATIEKLEKSYKKAVEKESYMSHILDNIPIAIWARKKSSEIIYYNKRYSDITFGGMKRHDEENLEIDQKAKSYAERALKEKTMLESERPIIVGGNRFIYQFNDVPSSDGEVVVTAAWDITENEVLREKTKKSAMTNKYLLDSISYGCMIVGPDKRLTYFNEPLMKIWNLDATLLYSKPSHEEILDALYSINILPAQVNFENFKKSRSDLIDNITEPIEDLFYLPDGQCIRSVAIPYEDNCVLFTYEDVTTQLKLQRLNRSLRSIQQYTLDRLQEGVCIFNESGKLELMNIEMSEIWSIRIPNQEATYTLNDFIDNCLDESSKGSKKEIQKLINQALVSKAAKKHIIKNADGKILYRTISPMPDRTLIVSDLDITESMSVKNALADQNQALMDLDKVRAEFLGQMSNKLRGILGSIRGIYKLLLSQNSSNLTDEQRDFISNLAESGDYLAKLLYETENIVHLGDMHNQAETQEFDVPQSIKNILQKYKKILSQNKINLKVNIDSKVSTYKGNREKFEKSIYQYLSNALIRIHSNGKINISVTQEKDKLIISIEDNGLSIDGNSSTLSDLGIIMANAIIDMMGGITVTNFAEKKSISTTKITLPISGEHIKLRPTK